MNLFDKIKETNAQPHGWCTLEKAHTLANLILFTRPALAVEIGVWSGKSFLPIALACKEVGGKAIGIDPYTAAASVEGQNKEHAEWWSETITPEAYEWTYNHAIGQLKSMEVDSIAELWRKRSDECEVPQGIGLLHVDGNHSDQALRDVQRFAPAAIVGGHVVLDDLTWDGGGVTKAAAWLLANGFEELFRVTAKPNDWGVFRKVK